MSLKYFWKILTYLDMYNLSYGEYSTSYLVYDCLLCVDDFIEIKDEFDKTLNMKVVYG